jgi:hypothetical protein
MVATIGIVAAAIRLPRRTIVARMALSVVNGYLCFSSCDVAKALAGKNPHPSHSRNGPDASASIANDPADATRADQPAVLLGGALAEARGDDSRPGGAAGTAGTTAPAGGPGIDLLA